MFNAKICLKIFLLLFLVFQVFSNSLQIKNFLFKKNLLPGSSNFPGISFVALRPYLQDIRWMGYWSDLGSKNLDVDVTFMYLFQHVQVLLAPTILDHYNPWAHDYTLVYAEHTPLDQLAQDFHADIKVRIGEHIGLFKKRQLL